MQYTILLFCEGMDLCISYITTASFKSIEFPEMSKQAKRRKPLPVDDHAKEAFVYYPDRKLTSVWTLTHYTDKINLFPKWIGINYDQSRSQTLNKR